MIFVVLPSPTDHTSVAQYSLFVLKVPLNTKQTNKLLQLRVVYIVASGGS